MGVGVKDACGFEGQKTEVSVRNTLEVVGCIGKRREGCGWGAHGDQEGLLEEGRY